MEKLVYRRDIYCCWKQRMVGEFWCYWKSFPQCIHRNDESQYATLHLKYDPKFPSTFTMLLELPPYVWFNSHASPSCNVYSTLVKFLARMIIVLIAHINPHSIVCVSRCTIPTWAIDVLTNMPHVLTHSRIYLTVHHWELLFHKFTSIAKKNGILATVSSLSKTIRNCTEFFEIFGF